MKKRLACSLLVLVSPFATAADVEAGRAKVAAVCSACHGTNGVSVSDAIPNLAAQRAGYIEAQLKALKDGSRKNPIMNAMAAQLSPEDIANVAAYFATQPGAAAAAKSSFMPNLVATRVPFPENYRATYRKYHVIDFPANKQVRSYYASPAAYQAAQSGKPLPDGSVIIVEVQSAKLGADGAPTKGTDGHFEGDKTTAWTIMARQAGWGNDVPEMLRNENWNYAIFTADKQHRTTVNQAECLACHKPQDKESYIFTLKELTAAK